MLGAGAGRERGEGWGSLGLHGAARSWLGGRAPGRGMPPRLSEDQEASYAVRGVWRQVGSAQRGRCQPNEEGRVPSRGPGREGGRTMMIAMSKMEVRNQISEIGIVPDIARGLPLAVYRVLQRIYLQGWTLSLISGSWSASVEAMPSNPTHFYRERERAGRGNKKPWDKAVTAQD